MKIAVIERRYKHFDLVDANEIEMEAPDKGKLFGLFFRTENSHRYWNGKNDLSFTIKDESIRKEYDKWISNIHNYAANGGNMD
jgi:hypothetical protein